MKMAVHKLWSAQKLFAAVRSVRSQRIQRKEIIASSIIAGHYEKAIDQGIGLRKTQARAGQKAQTADTTCGCLAPRSKERNLRYCWALGTATAAFQPTIGPRGGRYDSLATSMVKSAMRAASSSIGRQIARGILGGILGGSGRRR
jgi:hypothetical protein